MKGDWWACVEDSLSHPTDYVLLRSAFDRTGEQAIEGCGEGSFVDIAVRTRSPGHHAFVAEVAHKIAHRQPRCDRFAVVFVATRVDDKQPFLDQRRGERQVGRDGDVAGFAARDDIAIRLVGPLGDLDAADLGHVYGRLELAIGDKDRRDIEPFGGTKNDLLDLERGRVTINPDFQHPVLPLFCAIFEFWKFFGERVTRRVKGHLDSTFCRDNAAEVPNE